MRAQLVFVVVAAWLLLLTIADARAAKVRQMFNGRTALKLARAKNSRVFHAQQSRFDPAELEPASDDPVCQEAGFAALVNSTAAACEATYFPSVVNSSLSPTLQAHREAWMSYCASPCTNHIKTSVIDSKYWICLQPELQYFAAETNYDCTSHDSHGDVCGLAISRFDFAYFCDWIGSASTCRKYGSGSCVWMNSECAVNTSQAVFDAMCGACMKGLNQNVLSKFRSLSFAADLLEATQSLCATSPSGAYCVPLLTSQQHPDILAQVFESNSGAAAFCQNDDMVTCVAGTVAVQAAEIIAEEQESFVECATFWDNVSADVTQRCLPDFLEAVSEAQEMLASVGAMCTNFNGTYCIPAFYELENATAEGSGRCPNVNGTILKEELGCCIGTVQSLGNLMQTMSTDPTLIPAIPGYTPPPAFQRTIGPAPPTQHPVVLASGEELSPNPGNGGLFALAACGVTGLNESLRVRCSQHRFKVAKDLLLKLDYAAVTATAPTTDAFMASFRRDVARTAKVSPSQIAEESVAATTRVVVTLASGRGMHVQTTSSGVQYSYTLLASSKALALAASGNIDAAVDSSYVEMTNTRATVQEMCPACVGSGGVASVNQVSSTTIGTTVIDTTTSSGAATIGALFAVAVAALSSTISL